MSRGVHVELCGATAKAHHYGNEDLIPGIKLNADAMARTTELVQQGFVRISESCESRSLSDSRSKMRGSPVAIVNRHDLGGAPAIVPGTHATEGQNPTTRYST